MAETSTNATAPTSFQIADVEVGDKRLDDVSAQEALQKVARTRVVVCGNPNLRVVEEGNFQSLIAAAALAYKRHFPLILYPDAIWVTVLQGVAQHVSNYALTLRSQLVTNATKIELVVNGLRLPQSDREMLEAVREFVAKIETHCVADKRFLLRTEFSGTNDAARIAGAVALMDMFQPYFDYVFAIICGIPSVTLEGTPQDWDLLAEKVRALHESDLELSWWTKHLLPLCEHFCRAVRGDVDPIHWGNLCKIHELYGRDDLNGWILKFIPYVRRDRNSPTTERNPVLELTAYGSSDTKRDPHDGKITGCTADMLPGGLSYAPVSVMENGRTTPMQFVAGFVGVTQSNDDFSLRPELGWAIAEQSRIDRLIARVREKCETKPALTLTPGELQRLADGSLSGDFCKFYSEFETIRFERSTRKGEEAWLRVVSPRELRRTFEKWSIRGELAYLKERGLISKELFDARSDFAQQYGQLVIFAESYSSCSSSFSFACNIEGMWDVGGRESRGEIYKWNGQPTEEGFEPVAKSFTDWLEMALDGKL